MTVTRIRIRFRKAGDLRLISHRDLIRTFERLFRRCEVPLALSEGFHPKPKLSFPAALALGISADEEVMETRLREAIALDDLQQRLTAAAPEGLQIRQVEQLETDSPKTRVESVTYQVPVPEDRRQAAQTAIEKLWAAATWPVERKAGRRPVDARAQLAALQLEEGVLTLRLHSTREAAAGPRDILRVLGLEDLEHEGCLITRTEVEVAT